MADKTREELDREADELIKQFEDLHKEIAEMRAELEEQVKLRRNPFRQIYVIFIEPFVNKEKVRGEPKAESDEAMDRAFRAGLFLVVSLVWLYIKNKNSEFDIENVCVPLAFTSFGYFLYRFLEYAEGRLNFSLGYYGSRAMGSIPMLIFFGIIYLLNKFIGFKYISFIFVFAIIVAVACVIWDIVVAIRIYRKIRK